jgi:hypothetical protein
MRASRLSLILAVAAVPACQASAQTLPWPTDSPRAGAPAAPGPMAMPGAMSPMGAPPQGMAPPASAFGGAGAEPPCMAEFVKMRDEVQKKGLAAKAASERKPTREEMCKHITLLAAAETKWVKFTESNVASCGIPGDVAQQLKAMHGRTEQARKNICAPGAAAAPVAPSLSDALGTTRLPMPETTKSGSGTLDTLTGNAIQK